MIGEGLITTQDGAEKSPRSQIKNPIYEKYDKYPMRQSNNIDNASGSDSRKNLQQRNILSSAESTNHFITKTKVGGTLKNSRHIVAGTGGLNSAARGIPNHEINDFI